MKRCFVFSAGSFYGLFEIPAPGDVIIAADAGYLLCRSLGLQPDLTVGDFDSAPPPDGCCLRVPAEKDDTDTMLALREGLSRGCDAFVLYGSTGGNRLDHTLANLQSLLFLHRQGAEGRIYDKNFVYTALENGGLRIPKTVEWGLLSVFAPAGAEGVTLRGVQYPLTDAVLTDDFPLGVSNHILASEASVSVRRGVLLLGWEIAEPMPAEKGTV